MTVLDADHVKLRVQHPLADKSWAGWRCRPLPARTRSDGRTVGPFLSWPRHPSGRSAVSNGPEDQPPGRLATRKTSNPSRAEPCGRPAITRCGLCAWTGNVAKILGRVSPAGRFPRRSLGMVHNVHRSGIWSQMRFGKRAGIGQSRVQEISNPARASCVKCLSPSD